MKEKFMELLDAAETKSGKCAGGEFWSSLGTLIASELELDADSKAKLALIFGSIPDSPSAARTALEKWRNPTSRSSRRVIKF